MAMDPVLDRDETVAAFRNFYHFLAKMFMDDFLIMESLLGDITPDIMRSLNMTDEVVDLLRHLSSSKQTIPAKSKLPTGQP
ncbi:hypothetical protein EKO04_002573 [Ascochyta lentis]|uniref:Uncharacterized protein n=1 Tax=Ascochyta lentis TaxID=205686 RepID=A0A8H7JAI2_9PLEO|nr:hypothetical protein EKO04_002573 [Ascochyta lentis]